MKLCAKWAKDWLGFGLGTLLTVTIVACPSVSTAQGQLETPQPGSFQSGISLVRGWVCEATRVDIEVPGRGALPAVYGEPRSDTQAVCGDANNGFSLQINWNDLGEGTHTVRALVDGVELGRVQIIVATLGEPYLKGAQGDFVIESFPQSGKQTRLRWEESRQLFVLANNTLASAGGSSPRTDAKLEDPRPGTFQSGIGLIRGWICTAGRVDIEIDGRSSLPAVYGEPRGDTQTVCGDSNNGFSLLVNWNDLSDGTHTVRARADGVELGSATFSVATLGLGSFPRGLSGDFVLNNFPQPSLQTEVRWQESQQNFVITGARFPGQDSVLCTTRSGEASDGSGGKATINWTNPCLLSGNTLLVRVQVPNSAIVADENDNRESQAASAGTFSVCAANLRIEQGLSSVGPADIRLVDIFGNEICRHVPQGVTLEAVLQVNSQSHLNFNNPFLVFYHGSPAVAFPADLPEGKPALTVSVPDLIFDAATTSTPQEKSFTITNTGGGTLQGGMVLMASDTNGHEFSLTSAVTIHVGAGQSQTVTLRFSPVSTDLVTGSLRITTNGGARSVVLRGQGQSGQARLTVSPTTLEFGNVDVPGTVDRTFSITNSGAGILTGHVDIRLGSFFSVTSGETFSLGTNQSQTITVRFAPKANGPYIQDATVISNGGSVVVKLYGTGIAPIMSIATPDTLSPTGLPFLDFGNHCGNKTKSFSISNVGGGTLIGTVTTESPFHVTKGASFSLTSFKKQTVSVKLKWNPKNYEMANGIVHIESNAGTRSIMMLGTCWKIKFN